MSTEADTTTELDVDMDATVPCVIPECERPATHHLVGRPCRHPGQGAACQEHITEALAYYRELCDEYVATVGHGPECRTCQLFAVSPYADAVPL